MAPNSLHCAVCKHDISEFYTYLNLPRCRHLFCRSCYMQHFSQQTKLFLCPIDELPSDSKQTDGPLLSIRVQVWLTEKRLGSSLIIDNLYREMLAMVNLTLFPCYDKPHHQGFEDCPFDHSQSPEPAVQCAQEQYCYGCQIFVTSAICPRCSSRAKVQFRPRKQFQREQVKTIPLNPQVHEDLNRPRIGNDQTLAIRGFGTLQTSPKAEEKMGLSRSNPGKREEHQQ